MAEANFFWDPLSDNILQERDAIGALTAEYTTEPGLYGNVVSQNRGGVESQFHFDALGSTLALTDGNQQVTGTQGYSAFGESTESTGTFSNFQYIGRSEYYRASATGDYIVRRRSYSPLLAAWLSVDPDCANLAFPYCYCGNSPQTRSDPSGCDWLEVPPGIYIATTERDTFEELIGDIVPYLSTENRSCIRPIPTGARTIDNAVETKWAYKKPARCGIYDLGNLLDTWPDGGHLRAGIGTDIPTNRYIAAASAFYGAEHFPRTAQLVAAIERQSGTGKTPLSGLTLIGHGAPGGRRIGSLRPNVGEFFAFSDLGPNPFKWPTYADAVAGVFPYACYFRTDSKIRFVGCKTSAIAQRIASSTLRFGATSYGTLANTFAVSDSEMGFANDDFEVYRDVGTARTPPEYHDLKRAGKPLWRGYAGRN